MGSISARPARGALPFFVPDGRTPVRFAVNIVRSDLLEKFVQRILTYHRIHLNPPTESSAEKGDAAAILPSVGRLQWRPIPRLERDLRV